MVIEILDGKDCIGGNQILITSEKNYSIFLDFGKNFQKYFLYYEEFLTPRNATGVFDLWRLNLIPKIKNIYRNDIWIDELFSKFEKDFRTINLEGVFLSHAHLDHAGYVPLLKGDIPIVLSSISVKFLKEKELIKSQLFNEFTCVNKRRVATDKDFGEKVIMSEEMGKKVISDRKFITIDIDKDNYKKEDKLKEIKYIAYKIDHSIYGSLGFFIEIDSKGIAYTGDIRFHGKNKEYSYKFVEELKN